MELTVLRATLSETRQFTERNGMALLAGALPEASGSRGPFDFSVSNRERLFNLGERLGATGEAWNLVAPGPSSSDPSDHPNLRLTPSEAAGK